MKQSLSVTEFGTLPIGATTIASLSEQEADRLERIGERRPGFCERGRNAMRFRNYAGLVSLGDRMLEVLPKIDRVDEPIDHCRGVLLRLLRLAPRLRLHVDGNAAHAQRGGALLEVFLHAYFDEVTTVVRGGLLRRYQRHEADLTVVRGRLDMRRQVAAHAMRPDILACRYQTLSSDNDWNRVLKAALAACRPWLSSLSLRRRWAELWPAFDEVSLPANPKEVFVALSPDRQSARYADALRWARWIVASATPNLRAGDGDAPAMLFDTNALFEEAVATAIRQRHSSRESRLVLRTQLADSSLAVIEGSGRAVVGLRPDLVLDIDGSVVAIGDTKWKCLSTNSFGELLPDRQDVHQMLAYAAAFRCANLALLYPWHSGLAAAVPTRLKLPELGNLAPVLDVLCVDVGADGLPERLGNVASDWA